MADQHDQALEWAQQNSNDPRAQDIMAKAWASKNPSDPRASAILQKFNSTSIDTNPVSNKTLSPDDYTKPGENIPKDSGLTEFMRYNVNHFNPTSPQNLMGAAGASQGVSNVGRPVTSAIQNAARRAGIMDKVKNEAELGPYVKGAVDSAEEAFNRQQIQPRMVEREARMQGKTVKVNPEDFQGVTPELDAYSEKLKSMLGRAQGNGITSSGNAATSIEIPATEALQKVTELNDASKFLNKGAYADPAVAAKGQKAYEAANSLRSKMSEVDPSMRDIGQDLNTAYDVKNAVVNPADKNPISSVSAPQGSDKGSLISQFDRGAGSNLRQLGQDIDLAKTRLTGQGGIVPSVIPGAKYVNMAGSVAPRVGGAAAQKLSPYIERADQATPPGYFKNLSQLLSPRDGDNQ